MELYDVESTDDIILKWLMSVYNAYRQAHDRLQPGNPIIAYNAIRLRYYKEMVEIRQEELQGSG
jgi:hypothetical protein